MNNITKFISLFYFRNGSEYVDSGSDIESGSSIPSDSDVEYTPVHVLDSEYTGEISQSQACFKHGVSYTPPGWKRVYIKRKRIHVDEEDEEHHCKKKIEFDPDES